MSEQSLRFLFDLDARQILINTGKVEIGQHVHSAFQQIVANSLQIDKAHIRVSPVTTHSSVDDGLTAGSLSMQVTGLALRNAALSLRAALIQEAAQHLDATVDDVILNPATLDVSARDGSARDGSTRDRSTKGKRCSVFDLKIARDLSAAKTSVDTAGDSAATWSATSTISKSITGEREYIQDLVLPGMIHARALRSRTIIPTDSDNVSIVRDGGFSAVVADTEAALELAWAHSQAVPTTTDASCDGPVANWIHKRSALMQTSGEALSIKGCVSQHATRPFLLHASIAPSCAIARFKNGKLEIWTHSQGIFGLRNTVAQHLELPIDSVVVRHVPSAGSYGHTAADDAVMDAVLVSLQTDGAPVRVVWTRQDDFQHAPVGAPMQVQIEAQLAEDNSIASWHQTIWSGPHGQRPGSGGNVNLLAAIEQNPKNKSTTIPDLPDAIGGGAARNATPPYSIGSLSVTSHLVQDLPVRTSSIRGLGAQMNVVCIESAMEKLAASCDMDALEFRLMHLADPRGRKVLRGLSSALDSTAVRLQESEAIGIGYSRYKEKAAYAAVAAHVRLSEKVELFNVWAIVDAGQIIDRSGALNQIEGGIIQAASWTLCEGVLLRDGVIDAAGWEDYPIMTWSEIPDIHTTLIGENRDLPYLGVGECMVGPVSAAIVNAVSSLAGCSMSDLPLTPDKFILAATRQD